MSALRNAALRLAAKGMRVFPCRERGKEPMFKRWPEYATTDPNRINNWWSSGAFNIGIATGPGSGVWVLDPDNEDHEGWLRKHEAIHGALPPTVEAITGKGRHLYFKWPLGKKIQNVQNRGDFPDVRGDGGYVLAPPSIHPSGRAYAWSVDSAGAFADAPDWLIELVTKRTSSGGPIEPITPEHWRSFLGETVDGSHRGSAIARLYGLLIRRWIDPYVALDLVRFFNALRCDPPLDDHEVRQITDDIAKRQADQEADD
jgi:Bifunctional DNA primase/polymerase, N-terminal